MRIGLGASESLENSVAISSTLKGRVLARFALMSLALIMVTVLLPSRAAASLVTSAAPTAFIGNQTTVTPATCGGEDCGGPVDPPGPPQEGDDIACSLLLNDHCVYPQPVVINTPYDFSEFTLSNEGLEVHVEVLSPATCSYADGNLTVFEPMIVLSKPWRWLEYLGDAPERCALRLSTDGNESWLPVEREIWIAGGVAQHVEVTFSRDGIERGPDEEARVGDKIRVTAWVDGDVRLRSYSIGQGSNRSVAPPCSVQLVTAAAYMGSAMHSAEAGAVCTTEFVIPEPNLATREFLGTIEEGCAGSTTWDLGNFPSDLKIILYMSGQYLSDGIPLVAYQSGEAVESVPNACEDVVSGVGSGEPTLLQSFYVEAEDRRPFWSEDTATSWDLDDLGIEPFSFNDEWTLPSTIVGRHAECGVEVGYTIGSSFGTTYSPGSGVEVPALSPIAGRGEWFQLFAQDCSRPVALTLPGPVSTDDYDLAPHDVMFQINLGSASVFQFTSLEASTVPIQVRGGRGILSADMRESVLLSEGAAWSPSFWVGIGRSCRLEIGWAENLKQFIERANQAGICEFSVPWSSMPALAGSGWSYQVSVLGDQRLWYSNNLTLIPRPASPEITAVTINEGTSTISIDPGSGKLIAVELEVLGVSGSARAASRMSVATESELSGDRIAAAGLDGACDETRVEVTAERVLEGGATVEPFEVECTILEGQDLEIRSVDRFGQETSAALSDLTRPPEVTEVSIDKSNPSAYEWLEAEVFGVGGAIEYQWYRCDAPSRVRGESVPDTCEAISGATSIFYRTQRDDVGKYLLTSGGIATAYGEDSLVSATTARVGGVRPQVVGGGPQVFSAAIVGSPLYAYSGDWLGAPEPRLSYQWLRCRRGGAARTGRVAGCTRIARANEQIYVPRRVDFHVYLRVEVTAVNSYGKVIYVTAATSRVARR